MKEIIVYPKFEHNISISEDLIDEAKSYTKYSFSESTRKFYAIDWRIFSEWCSLNNVCPLPASPETIFLFLTDQTINHKIAPATLVRRLAAIRLRHSSSELQSPTKHHLVRRIMQGIRRKSTHVIKKKSAATVDRIEQIISYCPDNITGLRDKALLILGFAGAFRRSELVSLKVEDIEKTDDGVKVLIRRSKTDQEGRGQKIAIPNGTRFRVVDTLFNWLTQANIENGYLFRSINKAKKISNEGLCPKSVAYIIKKYAAQAGLNVDNFAGHSLRAGFITSAAKAGASIHKMMEVSRHTNANILIGYIRNENLFENHAGEKFL